jgi:DNA-binding phage protein
MSSVSRDTEEARTKLYEALSAHNPSGAKEVLQALDTLIVEHINDTLSQLLDKLAARMGEVSK